MKIYEGGLYVQAPSFVLYFIKIIVMFSIIWCHLGCRELKVAI